MAATKPLTIALPTDLLRETKRVASVEATTPAKLVEIALRQYLTSHRWQRLRQWGAETAKRLNLKSGARSWSCGWSAIGSCPPCTSQASRRMTPTTGFSSVRWRHKRVSPHLSDSLYLAHPPLHHSRPFVRSPTKSGRESMLLRGDLG